MRRHYLLIACVAIILLMCEGCAEKKGSAASGNNVTPTVTPISTLTPTSEPAITPTPTSEPTLEPTQELTPTNMFTEGEIPTTALLLPGLFFDPRIVPATVYKEFNGEPLYGGKSVERWPELTGVQEQYVGSKVAELKAKGVIEKFDSLFKAWVDEYNSDPSYSLMSVSSVCFTLKNYKPLEDFIRLNDPDGYILIDRFMKARYTPEFMGSIEYYFLSLLTPKWFLSGCENAKIYNEIGEIVRDTNNVVGHQVLKSGQPYILPDSDTNMRDVICIIIELRMDKELNPPYAFPGTEISFDPEKIKSTVYKEYNGSKLFEGKYELRWPELDAIQQDLLNIYIQDMAANGITEQFDKLFKAWTEEYISDPEYAYYNNRNTFFMMDSYKPLEDFLIQNDPDGNILIDRYMKARFTHEDRDTVEYHFLDALVSVWLLNKCSDAAVNNTIFDTVYKINDAACMKSAEKEEPYLLPSSETNMRDTIYLILEQRLNAPWSPDPVSSNVDVSFDPKTVPATIYKEYGGEPLYAGNIQRWPELSDAQKNFLNNKVSELKLKGITEQFDKLFKAWTDEYFSNPSYSYYSYRTIYFTFNSYKPLRDYIKQNDPNGFILADRYMKARFTNEDRDSLDYQFLDALVSKWFLSECDEAGTNSTIGKVVRDTNNLASEQSLKDKADYILPSSETNMRDTIYLILERKMKE